jgi:hypothetical protein
MPTPTPRPLSDMRATDPRKTRRCVSPRHSWRKARARCHHHFVEAVIFSWIGVRAAQRYGLLPTALFGIGIAAFCINPLLGAAYVIAMGFLWLFWQIMRGLGVPFSLAVAFALALIALAGTAHAESWAMRCHNSVDGSDYDVSWHGDSGFVIIAAPGKSPINISRLAETAEMAGVG